MSMEIKSTGLMANLPQSASTRPGEVPEEPVGRQQGSGEIRSDSVSSSPERLHQLAERLNETLSSSALKFEVDASHQTAIIKVVDTQDNKVIRQIPSEEALARLEMIQRYLEQSDYGDG
ncbi:flagellar protein FlaG, partial [Sulfurivirga caldicuralii]